MMRALHKLSARSVAGCVAPGRYSDGGNLYLSISTNGGRRWIFLFRWKGKRREMGLGSARDVSLARAREKAAEARTLLADGLDPLKARNAIRAIPSFGEAADALIASMSSSWKNAKHRAQWEMTLRDYAAPIRSKPVDEISTEDVLGILTPIWQTKAETASRIRGRIESVLDAAKANGHRSSENPARWRGHLDKLLPPRKRLTRGHHRAMHFGDVPLFLTNLRVSPSTSNLALELTILAATRSGETMGATWSEMDLEKLLWTIPGARMKAGQEHVVPITPRMQQILEVMRARKDPASNLIFPGQRRGSKLSVMAFTMALRRITQEAATVHGFRSAFRDWCGDCTDFPREVAEAALAHTIENKTEAAYRRSSALAKRRQLMESWEKFLAENPHTKIVSIVRKMV